MSLQSACGTFLTGTGTTAVSVTGLSFQPSIVLFLGVQRNGPGATAGIQLGVGAATDSTHRWYTACSYGTAITTSATRSVTDGTHCFGLLTNGGGSSVYGALDFTSMNADGFTVTPTTAFPANTSVLYLALGGTSLTNVAVGTVAMSTTNANFSVTGLGFQPTAALFSSSQGTALGTIASNVGWGLGWMDGTHQGTVSIQSANNVTTTASDSILTTADAFCQINVGATTLQDAGAFVSWDAGGFTLSHPTHSGSAHLLGYVALAGARVAIGTFSAQSSAGNFTAISGLSFSPSALVVATAPVITASQTAGVADTNVAFGMAASAMQRGAVWAGEKNGLTGTSAIISDMRLDTTHVAIDYNPASTFGLVGDIDVVSFDSAGVTLNQTNADANGGLVLYLALGPAAATGGSRAINARLGSRVVNARLGAY